MLDIKAIRQNPELVASALLKRGMTFDQARFEALDARRKEADVRAQNLLAERKSASKRIGELVASGKSCLLYTSPSPRDKRQSRMPSSA